MSVIRWISEVSNIPEPWNVRPCWLRSRQRADQREALAVRNQWSTETSEKRKERNTMASLAFALPLRAGKTEEWRAWSSEILGPRRSEYEAFSRKLGLKTQRAYLQHTPQGDQAIIYMEGNDLQRTFRELQMSQDPFAVLLRQQTQDLFGVDLTQTDPGALSQYVFTWPSAQEDEASYKASERMERLGMIRP